MSDQANKRVLFEENARAELVKGVNIIADAVKVTLGPRGRNVIIESPEGAPIITKDGVTVARSINLRDRFQNLGVQVVKEAASRTNDLAGDGTTTATVLSQAIVREGYKMLTAGFSSVDIKAGIDFATEVVISELRKLSVPIKDKSETIQVATISANGDRKLGELIAEAIHRVGREGVVTVEEAKGFETTLDVVEGMQIDRGYVSPYFVTNNNKMTAEYNDPYVLLANSNLQNVKEIVHILERVNQTRRPLIIIADEIEGEALQTCIMNHIKGVLSICVIKAPGFGEQRTEMLLDLAALTNAKVAGVIEGLSLDKMTIKDLGTCRRVIVSRNATTFVGSTNVTTEGRISAIRHRLEDRTVSDEEREYLKLRLAKLSGGVGVIRVGGVTEVDVRERRDRVDDALNATRAAAEEGIVPGGGVALVRASKVLDALKSESLGNMVIGIEVIQKACLAPLAQITINAGMEPAVILEKLYRSDPSFGFNAARGEFEDMIQAGIVDPVKVTRVALENAASVGSLLLTVNASVVPDNGI